MALTITHAHVATGTDAGNGEVHKAEWNAAHSISGTLSADDLTDGTTNKVYTASEKTKLSGIATNATANSSDATLLNRANHTGTQSADTITDGTTNKVFTATEQNKLSGIEAGADVTDATNVNAAGAVMNSDTSTAGMSFVVDEDNMASNSATKVPTQQSVKAYIEAQDISWVAALRDGVDSSLDTFEKLVTAFVLELAGKAATDFSNVSQSDARTKVGTGTMAYRNVTISASDPSGGANGDIWLKVT